MQDLSSYATVRDPTLEFTPQLVRGRIGGETLFADPA
jgi:hypothetical protein